MYIYIYIYIYIRVLSKSIYSTFLTAQIDFFDLALKGFYCTIFLTVYNLPSFNAKQLPLMCKLFLNNCYISLRNSLANLST